MDTIEAMDLPAAGFRRAAERLAERATAGGGDDRYEDSHPEIDAVLTELPGLYQDATDAYLTARAWRMEVEQYREQDEIGPAVARREQQRVEAIVEDYRAGRKALDAADAALGIDVWERVDPDTQLYDPDEYVEEMGFEIEYGGLMGLLGRVDTVYERAAGVYERLR